MNVSAVVGGRGPAIPNGIAKRAPLSMYAEPPSEELTLEDFEVRAFERLAVLKAIESAKSRSKKGRELKEAIALALQTHIGKESDRMFERNDNVSHHILRLAYCGSQENRNWFLTYECALFKYRAELRAGDDIATFMSDYGMHFTPVPDDERRDIEPQLRQVAEGIASKEDDESGVVADKEYYKIPFLEALELVKTRSVFLKGGYAYVPRNKMVSILHGRFRTYLSASLIHANLFLPEVLRDERLKPMLINMSKAYTGPEYGASRKSVDHVGAEDVDGLAASAFPLCMQNMHSALKEKHRLKHLGRLQYGLFLKGVGLSIEDALVYWQREFTKGMSGEEFTKKYAYNIRYNYGKEGKRADFSPYSCVKIVTAPAPGGDEVHGCPYKTWDLTNLRAALGKMKIAPAAIESIADSVRTRDYQVACRKQYEARYPGADSSNVGNHPNAYTEAANKFLKGDALPEKPAFSATSEAKPAAGEVAKTSTAPAATTPGAGGAGSVPDDFGLSELAYES